MCKFEEASLQVVVLNLSGCPRLEDAWGRDVVWPLMGCHGISRGRYKGSSVTVHMIRSNAVAFCVSKGTGQAWLLAGVPLAPYFLHPCATVCIPGAGGTLVAFCERCKE